MLNFILIYSKNKKIPKKILTRFIDEGSNKILFKAHHVAYFLSGNESRLGLFYSDCELSQHLMYNPTEKSFSFFDGVILSGDDCVNDIRKITSDTHERHVDYFDEVGNYCGGCFSEHGLNFIHQSVLGIYSLFWGQTEEIFVISNNPHLVAEAIKRGKTPRANYLPLVANLCFGTPIDLETVYEGVYFFPNNAGCVIREDNHVEFQTLTDKLYKKWHFDDFDVEFNKAYESMLHAILSTKNLPNSFGNITGGMDSRTALALVKKCHMENKFDFSVRGPSNASDVVVAKKIADALKIPLTTSNSSGFQLDPLKYEKDMLKNIFLFLGSVSISEMGVEQVQIEKNISARCLGLFGEMIRFQKKVYSLRSMFNKLNFCKPKTKRLIFEKVIAVFKRMPDPLHYDLLFNWRRAASIHGGISHRTTFSFLLNTRMHNLAWTGNSEQISSSYVNFKIIEKSCPQLLKIPFEKHMWEEFCYKDRADAQEFRQITPVETVYSKASYLTSSQIVVILRKYLFHPDKKMFNYIDKRKYWNFIRENCGKDDVEINKKLCKFITLSFWGQNLKEGKIRSDYTSPQPHFLKPEEVGSGKAIFCYNDYGRSIFSIDEILKQNYITLMAKDALFMKDYGLINEASILANDSKAKSKPILKKQPTYSWNRIKYYFYKILSKLTWGKTRRKYKDKRRMLKQKLNELKILYSRPCKK